jgi:hypothetical protein
LRVPRSADNSDKHHDAGKETNSADVFHRPLLSTLDLFITGKCRRFADLTMLRLEPSVRNCHK